MALFNCKTGEPEWIPIEADSPEAAAQEYHSRALVSPYFPPRAGYKGYRYRVEEEDGRVHFIHFALVEVEGNEPLVSRIFAHGIWRKGGVKSRNPTLQEIADKLGWRHPPEELIGTWEGEEAS
jgi:hypothetical protein